MEELTPEEILAKEQSRQRTLEIEREVAVTREKQIAIEEKIAESKEAQMKILFELGLVSREQYREALKASAELKASREKELKVIEKQNEAMKKQEEIANRLNKKIEGFANSWRGGVLESVLETGVNFKDLGETMKKAFSAKNIAGLAIDTLVQSTILAVKETEAAVASLAAATGTGRQYLDLVADSARGAANMGVGYQEAAAAVQALDSSLTGFRSMNRAAQDEMTKTVASLETLGISSDMSAKQMDTSMRLLGMSASQARQSLDDQAAFAIGIGVAPAKMAADFQAAMPQLAAYGTKAEQIFEDLAVQSRRLGIEMNSLLGITKQFDTFEGAAEAAGKLNSILGGNLVDSTELMMATDAERIEILKRTVAASGKSFDSMNKFERMAIANAAGITNMAEANNLFSESSQKTAAELEEEKISQERLNEMKAQAVPMMKKLQLIMMQMAVAVAPLVKLITFLAEGLLYLNDLSEGLLIPLIGIYFAIKGIRMAMAATNVVMAASQGVTAALGATAPAAGGGLAAFGAAAAGAAPGVASLGVAGLKLGLVFIMIGLGIGVAAAGLALLVFAFAKMLELIIENIALMPEVIGFVYLLSIAFQFLGVSLVIAAVGIYQFAAALAVMLAVALISVPTTVLLILGLMAALTYLADSTILFGIALNAVFGGIAFSMQLVYESVSGASDKILEAISALNNFEGGGFVTAMEVVQNVTTENVDNISGVVDQAERYVQVQAQMKILGAVDAFTSALGNFIPSPGSEAAGKNEKEVVLQLDDREFARAVTNALDGKMKLNLMGS